MGTIIRSHRELRVYQRAFRLSMQVYNLSKTFPKDERYSLTSQYRKSSRSVCANLAEAWRKLRYEGSFVSKLSDSEGEAAESQVWAEFALACGYITQAVMDELVAEYEVVISQLVLMAEHPEKWVSTQQKVSRSHARKHPRSA